MIHISMVGICFSILWLLAFFIIIIIDENNIILSILKYFLGFFLFAVAFIGFILFLSLPYFIIVNYFIK